MSVIRVKFCKFAPPFLGVADIVKEARYAHLHVDESRQLISYNRSLE